jgi:hypothetical protein
VNFLAVWTRHTSRRGKVKVTILFFEFFKRNKEVYSRTTSNFWILYS